jgi:hexosaminidase
MESAAKHYAVDPLKGDTAILTEEERKRVLGGEAAMWEELATLENIDAKLWPRLAAIAERFWSPESVTDVSAMYRRMEQTSRWMELQGIAPRAALRRMLERLAGDKPVEPIAIFASVLEPIKGYTRHRARTYTSQTAFNRLVDAIPPESDAAREFRDAAERFTATHAAADGDYLQARLTAWRANVSTVLPILRDNALLAEQIDVANTLRDMCTMGLEALDVLRNSRTLAVDQIETNRARAAEFLKPHAEDLIQIAPGIRKLVDAVH